MAVTIKNYRRFKGDKLSLWGFQGSDRIFSISTGHAGRIDIVCLDIWIISGKSIEFIIDKVYVKTDKSESNLHIYHYDRISSGHTIEATTDFILQLATSGEATLEVQRLGSNHPEIPLWISDKGDIVYVSAEGTTVIDLLVNARRGKMYPENPSEE